MTKEGNHMMWLYAAIIGGGICAIGQILMDVFKFTPAYTLSIFVVGGAVLSGLGFYQPLLDFSGAGAAVPITNFGNVLVQGALQGAASDGFIGIFSGVMRTASVGLSAAIFWGFLTTCLFRAKE